jgi:predicted O-methyltransferase YrrM
MLKMPSRFILFLPYDPFADVRKAYEAHRVEHGRECGAYAISHEKALFLSALAVGAGRVLEIGTALGYSTLWLAHGVGETGCVDTIEREQRHAKQARKHFETFGVSDKVGVHVGDATNLVPTLDIGYGLIFLDVDWHMNSALWPDVMWLLRPGGKAVFSNLWIVDERDERSGTTERQAARTLLRQLQSDPSLAYSVVTAGSPLVLVSKRTK